MLMLIVMWQRRAAQSLQLNDPDEYYPGDEKKKIALFPSLSLFVYAIFFSYAYTQLSTATGALILFGTVQVSLLLWAIVRRQRLNYADWCGLLLANIGLIVLLLPGAEKPPISAAIMMIIAGIAWAAYTWVGRGSASPLSDTRNNFVLTLPLVAVLLIVCWSKGLIAAQMSGIGLAILSGSFASGLAYACWYKVLPHLSAAQAGMIQLLGPVLAGIAGVVLLNELLSLRLLISGLLILGGVAFSLLLKR